MSRDFQREAEMIRLTEKLIHLETRIQKQETLLFTLTKQRAPTGKKDGENSLTGNQRQNTLLPKSCHELKELGLELPSGNYWIDPDGQDAGDDPIYVYCDMTTGRYKKSNITKLIALTNVAVSYILITLIG